MKAELGVLWKGVKVFSGGNWSKNLKNYFFLNASIFISRDAEIGGGFRNWREIIEFEEGYEIDEGLEKMTKTFLKVFKTRNDKIPPNFCYLQRNLSISSIQISSILNWIYRQVSLYSI